MRLETKPSNSKKSKLLFFLIITVLAAIIFLMLHLLQGQVTVIDNNIKNEVTDSVVCTSSSTIYPKLSISNPDATELKINLAFQEDMLISIGLYYTMTFSDAEAADRANNILTGEISKDLLKAGYKSINSLNRKFSTYDNHLLFNIYASGDDINDKALPFFMLNDDINIQTKSQVINGYQQQGIECRELNQ